MNLRSRFLIRLCSVSFSLLFIALPGCGVKGPPLPPLTASPLETEKLHPAPSPSIQPLTRGSSPDSTRESR